MKKNVFFALYLLKGWIDFNKTCTNISFINAKEVSRF